MAKKKDYRLAPGWYLARMESEGADYPAYIVFKWTETCQRIVDNVREAMAPFVDNRDHGYIVDLDTAAPVTHAVLEEDDLPDAYADCAVARLTETEGRALSLVTAPAWEFAVTRITPRSIHMAACRSVEDINYETPNLLKADL
jgi:hypothetical protein